VPRLKSGELEIALTFDPNDVSSAGGESIEHLHLLDDPLYLALAVKLASIEWAARNGIVQLATRNDEENAPMLAINRKLGYRPGALRVEYLRAL
jgi:hypothetical protein